jgi:hypothetical protein
VRGGKEWEKTGKAGSGEKGRGRERRVRKEK